eukprot:29601-Amphidinium_carterae.1
MVWMPSLAFSIDQMICVPSGSASLIEIELTGCMDFLRWEVLTATYRLASKGLGFLPPFEGMGM